MQTPHPNKPRFFRRHDRPRVSLMHLFLGAALAVALVAQVQSSPVASPEIKKTAAPTGCAVTAKLVPTCGEVLAGVYARPRGGESRSASLRDFEKLTGTPSRIVHYFYTGDRLFPNSKEIASLNQDGQERLLLANWKADAGHSWAQVANGRADARIIRQAHYLRDHFNSKFYLTVHHEPENEVNQNAGSGYTAQDYAAMFRHVVSVLRNNGAKNFVSVLDLMGSQKWADRPWFNSLYPGDSYVDWLAFDSYAASTLGLQEGYFTEMMGRHYGASSWRGGYDWAVKKHPGKPVMLAEWGLGEKPGSANWKRDFFASVGPNLSKFPALKALVYFNNHDAYRVNDIRVNTTTGSLNAYKGMLRAMK